MSEWRIVYLCRTHYDALSASACTALWNAGRLVRCIDGIEAVCVVCTTIALKEEPRPCA